MLADRLQEILWPDQKHRVRIVGAKLEPSSKMVVLTVERSDDGVFPAKKLRAVTTTTTSTVFVSEKPRWGK